MCDCIEKVPDQVLEREKAKRPERDIKPPDSEACHGFWAGLDGVVRMFGDFKERMYATVTYYFTFTKTNGQTSKSKKGTVRILFTYCPFCGTKYPQENA